MKTLRVAACVLLLAPAGCKRSEPAPASTDTAASATAPSAASTAETKPVDALSLTGFEGEIDVVAQSPSTPAPVPLSLIVKNDAVRVDLPQELVASKDTRGFTGGGKVFVILKPTDKKMFVVLDAKKQAIAIDLDQVGSHMKAFNRGPHGGHDSPPADPPKVVKTGKKETIAGYACEDWDILNADKTKLTTCVAEKGVSFFHLPLTGLPTEHAWALELMDGKHFPLKGVSFGKDGAESGRVEVTKLDKHTVDAAQMEVPMGYKEVTIEEMFQGMGGGGLPPGDLPHGPPHGGHHGRHHGKP